MSREITKEEFDALETLIDRTSLATVLGNIGTICGEKAEHIAHNWQDSRLAARWEKAAIAVESCAAKNVVRSVS